MIGTGKNIKKTIAKILKNYKIEAAVQKIPYILDGRFSDHIEAVDFNLNMLDDILIWDLVSIPDSLYYKNKNRTLIIDQVYFENGKPQFKNEIGDELYKLRYILFLRGK